MEEQQRLEKNNCKGGHVIGSRVSYPSINANVLPSQSLAAGLDVSAT